MLVGGDLSLLVTEPFALGSSRRKWVSVYHIQIQMSFAIYTKNSYSDVLLSISCSPVECVCVLKLRYHLLHTHSQAPRLFEESKGSLRIICWTQSRYWFTDNSNRSVYWQRQTPDALYNVCEIQSLCHRHIESANYWWITEVTIRKRWQESERERWWKWARLGQSSDCSKV